MSGISSKAAGGVENKKKYNGIEFENNLDLNTYDANFRELDPQTGRWWQIDPKIESMEAWSPYASNYDNPITFSDPLGDEPDGLGPKQKGDGLNPFTRAIYNFFVLLDYAGSKINESNGRRTDNFQNNLQAINEKLTENIFAIQAGVEITNSGSSRPSSAAKSEETVVESQGVNVAERANQIHGVQSSFAQTKTTTAVGTGVTQGGEKVTMVASSNARLTPAQRAALNTNETALSNKALGVKSGVKIHAEQKITQYAAQNNISVQQVGASRPICPSCATAINNSGGAAASALKVNTRDGTYVKPIIY